MNVCVFGLWHLGTVTAACLAASGHQVVGLDFDAATVASLQSGAPPLFEPGLEELIKDGIAAGRLRFTADPAAAVPNAELVWVTYDTPVDADDQADTAFVHRCIEAIMGDLAPGALMIISSQLPVGSTRQIEAHYAAAWPDKPVTFACSPENLRLGNAISVFMQPDRVIAGVRSDTDRQRIGELLRPFTERIEWMTVESAEMTKHAINAFLALSITYINEVAVLCEVVGADAKEVERGLKSESRIGPRAYLSPGGPFAGGTLARDITYLTAIGVSHDLPTTLLSAVRKSNDLHKAWVQRKLHDVLGDLRGITVALWGLTYKPGTDTLRRSSAVELCGWLAGQGAHVVAHDPVVHALPDDLAGHIHLQSNPLAAVTDAHALVVATEWPDYQAISAADIVGAMALPVVIDANRFLFKTLGSNARIRYAAVGKAD